MEYRKLGRSGLKVSPLCLGAMMFGGPADEAESQRMIAAARDAGINFIDTADVYYLHREDLETPLEESVHGLGDLARSGMIRYFALSNHKAWRIAEICNIC